MLDKDERGKFWLYACRGAGKGCTRNSFLRDPKLQKRCEDCVPARNAETVGELVARLATLDA